MHETGHSRGARLLAPKLFYFCWFAAFGAFIPFVSLYYRHVGLDLGQIGLLVSVSGVVQLVAAPIWSVIADALRLRRALLPVAVAGTIVPVLLIGRSTSFGVLFVLALAQALFSAPVGALSDSATLDLLGDRRDRYGAQRVWGAVGWAASTLLFGWASERFGYQSIFVGYAVLAACTVGAALMLPRTQIAAPDLRAAARSLLRDSRWFGFLGCVLLISCCGATVTSFLSLYLQDLGASGQQIGLAQTIASVSELPVMALSPLVLRRWGARPLLVVAGLLYALRMALYIAAPTAGWALAIQALHGLCFGALWTAGVVEAQRLAPAGLEATGQTLFGMATFGVAMAAASALGGQIYRDYGFVTLFAIAGAAALLGGLGLLAVQAERRGEQAEQPVQ
jgi:PPP family 3-phenylpropionic acid transporter